MGRRPRRRCRKHGTPRLSRSGDGPAAWPARTGDNVQHGGHTTSWEGRPGGGAPNSDRHGSRVPRPPRPDSAPCTPTASRTARRCPRHRDLEHALRAGAAVRARNSEAAAGPGAPGRPPSTLLTPRALRGHGARCPALMHLPPESIASLRRTRPHGPFRTRGSDAKAAAARPRPSPDRPVAAPGRVRTRRRRARCLREAATGQIHRTGARGTRQLSARSGQLPARRPPRAARAGTGASPPAPSAS